MVSREQVTLEIFGLIVEVLEVDLEEVTGKSIFIDDLGAESIDMLDLYHRVGDVYPISLQAIHLLPEFSKPGYSVGDFLNVVFEKLGLETTSAESESTSEAPGSVFGEDYPDWL